MLPLTIHPTEEFGDPDIDIGRNRRWARRGEFLARKILGAWVARDFAGVGVWTPVAIGAGAAVYFGQKTEPLQATGAFS